ncbi:MAG: hypothetical protein M3237_00875 [Actinomycetota bacterium]|nr:hypothetical protein [Actinomycetota bacterium]
MVARRAIGVVAVAIFAAFCVGGWFLLDVARSDNRGHAAGWYGYEVRGDQLTVLYQGDTCEEERSLEVEESPTGIVVTVRVETHFQIPFLVACSSDGEALTARLEAPVGNRPVYDGSCLAAGGSSAVCREQKLAG